MKRLLLVGPVTIIGTALLLGVGGVRPAYAATTISVNTTSDEAATDGKCSLREAINNANANADTTGGDCAAGTPGADTVDLSALSGAIMLTGNLPTITDDLTISGPGAGVLTVNANGHEEVFTVGAVAATIAGLTMTGAMIDSSPPAPSTGSGIVSNGALTVRNSTITGNHAFAGGGIESLGPSLTVENSALTGNSGQFGGGIASGSPTATIENTTISGNSASDFGGGIDNFPAGPSSLTVEDSTLGGNTTASLGGAIENRPGATLTVTNSTLSGNSAQSGGGVDNWGTATAISSTITGNSGAVAGVEGGVRLENTILEAQKKGWNCGQAGPDDGYNIADDGTCGFSSANHSLSDTNPLLDPAGLQNNGGPTQTIALEQGSPAIDAIPGGMNGCGTTIATDQRGVGRPQGTGATSAPSSGPDRIPLSCSRSSGARSGASVRA